MKEILIISYFYPPCSLTAANRPAGWVKYFHNFGFKPIVITRNWDVKISNPEDQLRNSGNKVVVVETQNSEIHYLPYIASLRDKLFNSSKPMLKKGSKFLTIINGIGENYSNRFIPFSNFYDYASKLIEERSIRLMIISANPFIQFRFGYLLHKKYGISWIADYRDDWTTSEIIRPKNFIEKVFFLLQQRSEKKWVKTAVFITSVSEVYTKRIADFVNRRGETVLNGFDELYQENYNSDASSFVITYNGTLYNTQDVEGFLRSVLFCIKNFKNEIQIKVNFPGLAYDPIQLQRVKKLIVGYENHFFISNRIPKDQVIDLQKHSDLLLMLTHKGVKGIPSSKLFEYLALQKLILCFPSDFDIVENVLSDVNLGLIVNSEKEMINQLVRLINLKKSNNHISISVNHTHLKNYSILSQVKKLSSFLTQIST